MKTADGYEMFDKSDYDRLHELVFRDGYPGYKPSVVELPNGDGKPDVGKRYAHVAPKYVLAGDPYGPELLSFYYRAHQIACRAAANAEIAPAYVPDVRYGALRVLEYPPGEGSAEHTDFDLFTLLLYRDQPDHFVSRESWIGPAGLMIRQHNALAHVGEIGEIVLDSQATPHLVLPSETPQHSIVYFAIPDHDSCMPLRGPEVVTVREWLAERLARSRISGGYK